MVGGIRYLDRAKAYRWKVEGGMGDGDVIVVAGAQVVAVIR